MDNPLYRLYIHLIKAEEGIHVLCPAECAVSTIYNPISVIKLRRHRLRMTQDQLAEGLCSRQSIIKFETGLAAPSERLARKLADRLGMDPSSLAQAAKYDREQIALMKKATLEKDYDTLHHLCSEMLGRVRTQLARRHFQRCLEICNENLGQP